MSGREPQLPADCIHAMHSQSGPPEAEHPEMLQNTPEVQDSSHCTSSLTQDVLQIATLARGTGIDKVPGRQLTGPPVVFCSKLVIWGFRLKWRDFPEA